MLSRNRPVPMAWQNSVNEMKVLEESVNEWSGETVDFEIVN